MKTILKIIAAPFVFVWVLLIFLQAITFLIAWLISKETKELIEKVYLQTYKNFYNNRK